jgi:hypothetical protein
MRLKKYRGANAKMTVKSGKRMIRIINDDEAWKHGDWYKGLVGNEFSAMMYDIASAEYTVEHEGSYKRLPEKSVIIVSDTEEPSLMQQLKESISAPTMFTLADQLRDLKERKKELAELTTECSGGIEKTEQALVELMIQEEMQNFTRNSRQFVLTTKTYASARAERKQELFIWLKSNGFGDLVQEQVNAQSLAAFVREQQEEGGGELPSDLLELVNVYPKTGISIRKK